MTGTESVDGLPTPKVMLKSNKKAKAVSLNPYIESGIGLYVFA